MAGGAGSPWLRVQGARVTPCQPQPGMTAGSAVTRDNWKAIQESDEPILGALEMGWQMAETKELDPLVGERLDPGSLLDPQSPASALGLAGLWATLQGWRGCSMNATPQNSPPIVGKHVPGSLAAPVARLVKS